MVFLYKLPILSNKDDTYTISNNQLNIDAKHLNPQAHKYLVRNVDCLGFRCFIPERIKTFKGQEHNNLLTNISYSKKTHKKCLTMHRDGCPEVCIFRRSLFNQRTKDGWRWTVI